MIEGDQALTAVTADQALGSSALPASEFMASPYGRAEMQKAKSLVKKLGDEKAERLQL